MKKLVVVADWASDSLTCQEVQSSVEGFLEDPANPNIHFVSSTPSTIHTSFLVSQLMETEERYGRPLDTVIFQNTDPRLHTRNPVEKSKGAELFVVRLKSGAYILGPNSGYVYSMIKDKIEVAYQYPGLAEGSQFRSRDLYARVSAHLMDSLEDDLELEEIHMSLIPELQGYYIAHIDNYGNIKTTLQEDTLKETYTYGDVLEVTIQDVSQKVTYVNNLFGSTPGQLVIYPGSSGPKDNPYLEITSWSHFDTQMPKTGMSFFNNPIPGMKMVIQK